MSILLVILVLSFLVIIHEMGHLLVARWAKVKVEEFGIGYPPKVKELFRWRGIPITLNWIPFGGFVRLKGEDAEVGSSVAKGDYRAASRYRRMMIILAGVTINFLFGVLVFSAIFTFTGIPTPLNQARVSSIQDDSPAMESQFPTDVTITAIQSGSNKVLTPSVTDVQQEILKHRGESISLITTGVCKDLVCDQSEQRYVVYVRTAEETTDGQGAVGIVFQDNLLVQYPAWQMPFRGALYGTIQAVLMGKEILFALGSLVHQLVFAGSVPADLVGPIGIAAQAQQLELANQGWLNSVVFAAMISINLAIMNILPIPPLDGGHLLFILLEPVVKKKRLEKIEYWANYSGFIILIGMIILISVRDVWKLFV
ncbi:site-2 protease family protein [Candidatus Woesebacteria bacterium]|nr:site-2 protease family protein [Candidatus Woesebacteria bacterium]